MTRKETIQQLRDKRYTFQQIGNLLGISRQRVHQLISPNYIGGGTEFLREKIRQRDNFTCQVCGTVWQKGKRRLDVHRIDGDDDGSYGQSKNMSGWVTACHKCHKSIIHQTLKE